LVPGVNLRSVGTIRDAVKWPKRDNRKDVNKSDIINFDLLSPYTANKMKKGMDILQTLQRSSGKLSEFYTYNNVKIRNLSLKKGLQFYRAGLIKFLGNTLVKRLQEAEIKNSADLKKALSAKIEGGRGKCSALSLSTIIMSILNGTGFWKISKNF
jgi:hypothetical protein